MGSVDPGSSGTVVEMVPVCRTEFKLLANMRLERPDLPLKELAKALGYSAGAIRTWLKHPDYQRFENYLCKKAFENLPPAVRATFEQVQESFGTYADYMQARLLDILDTTEDPKLAAQIAQDWLDRAGHSAIKKNMTAGMTLHLTPEVLEVLMRREREAGLASPNAA